jgi:hypothetical protein
MLWPSDNGLAIILAISLSNTGCSIKCPPVGISNMAIASVNSVDGEILKIPWLML